METLAMVAILGYLMQLPPITVNGAHLTVFLSAGTLFAAGVTWNDIRWLKKTVEQLRNELTQCQAKNLPHDQPKRR